MQSPGPIFILAFHRGGGTVLMRVLNCHPDVVIWGEHNGLINRLAEMDELARSVPFLMEAKTAAGIAQHTRFAEDRLTTFDPWVNPFDHESFLQSCRAMIDGIFTRGLRPGQRWGWKEIRYYRPLTIQFLSGLYPTGQFIILRRDLADVAVSAILAPWTRQKLSEFGTTMPTEIAEAVIRDVTYALLAIENGFDTSAAALGPRCLPLHYHQLTDPKQEFIHELFEFCQLTLTDDIVQRIRTVLSVRAGGTEARGALGGVLSPAFIRARMNVLMPLLRAEIARDGVDRARLVATSGIGRYSWLMGDQMMRGKTISSLH